MALRAQLVGLTCLGLLAVAGCRPREDGPRSADSDVAAPAVAATAAHSGQGAVRTERVPPDSTRVQEPCTGPNWIECARDEERHALARAAGRVRREGGVLVFQIAGGRELRFADEWSDSFDHVQHRYLGPIPGLPIEVLALDYYEGGQYLAVHRESGDTTYLDALPLAAPDGGWVLTASADLEAGYAPNRLTIYRVTSDGLELAWREETGDYGATDSWGAVEARWLDSATVAFERLRADPNGPADIRGSGRVEYREGEWRMMLAPDA